MNNLLRTIMSYACAFSTLFVAASMPVAAAEFVGAQQPYHFVFPRDHGMHPNYRTEWWYFTGHLRAADGHVFGYELTFFRIGLTPGSPQVKVGESRWRTNQLYPAHFALSDISGKSFYVSEHLERGIAPLAVAASDHLDVHVDDWRAVMLPSGEIRLHARAAGHAINLTLHSRKPVVVHGHQGISRKGSCASCASHYYSLTRLETLGSVGLGTQTLPVHGLSWMDHEFASSQLGSGEVGWDWFALMLADGREVMIYRLRRRDGSIVPESSATIIAKDGTTRYLGRDDLSVQNIATWLSPHTNAVYPSRWNIHIPSENLTMIVTPALADQELFSAAGTPAYWEGASLITDLNGRAIGQAYVELTGYVTPLAF